jgi:hypothetical protein
VTRLVVKSHRPIQLALGVILLSMLMALVTWLVLNQGYWALIYRELHSNKQHRHLLQANSHLKHENTALHSRVMMLERTTNLDRQTETHLQKDIRDLQEKVFHLKGELEFYQGVMESSSKAKGLDINGIYVSPLPRKDAYRLKLILTHVNSPLSAEGTIDVSIEGLQNGKVRYLELKDISLDQSLDLSFKFSNFKRFEFNLAFPTGFTPQRVHVVLQPRNKKQSKITRVFDWPKDSD